MRNCLSFPRCCQLLPASAQFSSMRMNEAEAHQGAPYQQAPGTGYPNAKQGGNANVAIYLTLGVLAYIVLTTIICNLIRQNSYHYYYDFEAIIRNMRNEIMICAAVAAVISAIVAKSRVDRRVGIVAIAIVAFICCACANGDSMGIAIAPHIVKTLPPSSFVRCDVNGTLWHKEIHYVT